MRILWGFQIINMKWRLSYKHELGTIVKCKPVILNSHLKVSYQNYICNVLCWADKSPNVLLMCRIRVGKESDVTKQEEQHDS